MKGSRRRRGAVLLALALAAGGLAASEVDNRARALRTQVGPLVPALVARGDLRAGTSFDPRDLGRLLAVRQVPARYVPPDALGAAADVAGRRLAAPVAGGGYVTAGALEGGGESGSSLGPGRRTVDVAVAGGAGLQDAGSGARVDVLVTTEQGEGRGRTYLALEDVQLLAVRGPENQGDGTHDGAASRADATATLLVTTRQAVLLTAAQSFAREIRLLVRPPNERPSGRGVAVGSGEL